MILLRIFEDLINCFLLNIVFFRNDRVLVNIFLYVVNLNLRLVFNIVSRIIGLNVIFFVMVFVVIRVIVLILYVKLIFL